MDMKTSDIEAIWERLRVNSEFDNSAVVTYANLRRAVRYVVGLESDTPTPSEAELAKAKEGDDVHLRQVNGQLHCQVDDLKRELVDAKLRCSIGPYHMAQLDKYDGIHICYRPA